MNTIYAKPLGFRPIEAARVPFSFRGVKARFRLTETMVRWILGVLLLRCVCWVISVRKGFGGIGIGGSVYPIFTAFGIISIASFILILSFGDFARKLSTKFANLLEYFFSKSSNLLLTILQPKESKLSPLNGIS